MNGSASTARVAFDDAIAAFSESVLQRLDASTATITRSSSRTQADALADRLLRLAKGRRPRAKSCYGAAALTGKSMLVS